MLLEDEIQIGQIVYKIYGKIGEGTCGTVYAVECPQKKKYALKVIHNYGRDQRIKYLIDSQIAAQSRFSQVSFIIRIYGHTERYKKMYILFQLGEHSLRNRIEMNTHIELKQFLNICLDTSQGLYAVHNMGLIHRDIKPENIICLDKSYKITDFGSHQGGTVGDDFVGTILYMPPELLDQKSYSRRLDVWSLGVSLFETYFRIHPFFYLSLQQDEKQIDPRVVDRHLRENLAYLMPNFSFQKFLILINQKASREKVKKVSQIMQVTPPELLQLFCCFFKLKDERQGIDYFVGAFNSIIDVVKQRRRKQIKLLVKRQDLPFDFKLYTDTLEIFYELTSRYGLSMFSEVELRLQLCIYFWSHLKYSKSKIIEFYQQDQIKKNLKSRNELWSQIKSVLFKYWCELNTNKDLQFFNYLRNLRLRILLCGVYYDLKEKDPESERIFIKKVQQIISPEVDSLEELLVYYNTIEIKQMEDVEDYLTSIFYTK